jgi:hypothetical protein
MGTTLAKPAKDGMRRWYVAEELGYYDLVSRTTTMSMTMAH